MNHKKFDILANDHFELTQKEKFYSSPINMLKSQSVEAMRKKDTLKCMISIFCLIKSYFKKFNFCFLAQLAPTGQLTPVKSNNEGMHFMTFL